MQTQTRHILNRRVVLRSRPVGAPVPKDFGVEDVEVPMLEDDQVLLRTLYLSLDPYMRGRMSDHRSYATPMAIGDVMVGGTVSRVEASRHSGFAAGDLVLGASGWQHYAVSNGNGLTRLDAAMAHPSMALGVLGMPGFTAYMGLLDIGRPQAGDTVVVAAASGGVGSVVGQIARLNGCHVVGVAGGDQKCRHVVDELGFDACVDRRGGDFADRLAAACPKGIDVYFENVGGAVFDAVLPLLNVGARVPLCGLIAQYNRTTPAPGPDRLGLLTSTLLARRIRMQGFIIGDDYGDRYAEFSAAMGAWLAAGKIRFREHVVDGLENAPHAFIGMLEGENFGKLIVRLPNDQPARPPGYDESMPVDAQTAHG
ncbi:MAG: NADP-dependent oxidoreductase [Burkholderiales bacterium]